MKIIDLLNKIANGEEVPEKFELLSNNEIFNYDNEIGDYNGENDDYLFGEVITNVMNLKIFLNDEVEILEEDKKIEKIKVLNSDDENDISSYGVALDLKTLKNKTNEIIDYLMENNK